MSDWKRREADKLWEESIACENSGASFKSKQSEQEKIKAHLDKVGGVKRDPDRGELTPNELIDKKFKTDMGREFMDRASRVVK